MLYNLLMASVIRSDDYLPIQPSDQFILGSGDRLPQGSEQNGLFYRTDIDLNPASVGQEIIGNPADASLTDYQIWVEAGWKTEHGSYASLQRFTNKLFEEYTELQQAYKQGLATPTNREDIVSELGDVLWCTMALMSNGGAAVDSHLKNLLYDYCQGIVHFVDGQPSRPSWHTQIGQLATKRESLTVGDISKLIEAEFEPTPSTVMNVDANELFDEPDDHLDALQSYLYFITRHHDRQFGYHEDHTTQEAFHLRGKDLGRLGAQATLEVAFLAHHLTTGQASLREVVRHNVHKISGRIAEQRVDQSDGERPEHLR